MKRFRPDLFSERLNFGEESTHHPAMRLIPEPSKSPRNAHNLVEVANNGIYTGYRRVIAKGANFKQVSNSIWPLAEYETSTALVHVQLRPDIAEPLLPEEQDEINQQIFQRASRFSDLESDVCDVLMINWLKGAKSANHRASIETDDLCRMRGLKPKLAGNSHRGGYMPAQRLAHLKAAKTILDSWIIVLEVPLYQHSKATRRLESRPFVITDRIGDNRFSWRDSRCHDDCVDVLSFKYVVGEVFGAYLLANRQTALLSECALTYNARTQAWEKRLARYYSYLWRCRMRKRNLSSPVRVSTIFSEGLHLEIDFRRSSKVAERFAKVHRTLERDGVIAGWRYGRQDGSWSDWTVIIEPPSEIFKQYLGPGIRGIGGPNDMSSGFAI